jgi:hypothetical protein
MYWQVSDKSKTGMVKAKVILKFECDVLAMNAKKTESMVPLKTSFLFKV